MGEIIRVGVGRAPEAAGDDIVEALETADDIVIVGEASLGEGIGGLIEASEAPDVVVLDLAAPQRDALVLARRIALQHPSVGIVVLSPSHDRQDRVRAVRAGARGYMVKPTDRGELLDTVRRVAADRTVHQVSEEPLPLGPAPHDRTRSRSPGNLLSEREAEVLVLAASSYKDEEIADRLHIAQATVRRHVGRLCKRLAVPDRDAAVARATTWGFVLGRGRDSYAIWDVGRPEGPVERFPEAEHMQAWYRWFVLCSDRVGVQTTTGRRRRLFGRRAR